VRKRIAIALAVWVLLVTLATVRLPVVSRTAMILAVALFLLALLWGGWRLLRAALWKVGRRLAFSYFLIGVVPIPLLFLLLGAAGYLLSGFLLGHLYADAAAAVHADLQRAAEVRLAAAGRGLAATPGEGEAMAFALYRDGRRVAGDGRLPAAWPSWVASAPAAAVALPADADLPAAPAAAAPEPAKPEAEAGGRVSKGALAPRKEKAIPFFHLGGENPTLAVAAGDADLGVVALYTGDLEAELSARSDVWVNLYLPAAPGAPSPMRVQVGGHEFSLQLSASPERAVEAAEFFAARAVARDAEGRPSLWDRPLLWWTETAGPLLSLADGTPVASYFGVTLNGSVRTVRNHLFSTSADFDAKVWGALLFLAFLLFDVYVVAALMAVVMIYALSRAVNRLSRATAAVRGGDFSVRIPAKRRDQVGELQRSFNQMAANLEGLVATATEKELLEKELAIARTLQRSLLPQALPAGEAVEFSLLFAPSAAIGGDYFDVFHLGDGRLAVVVADVSGHGLPSGLRMAMLKAALTILVEEGKPPEEILGRLDDVVRAGEDTRLFVTATLALFDLASGELEITNAGHPPTYLLRGPAVEEIALPGSPLGGLGRTYGRRTVALGAGDLAVWLSDGLIEAADAQGRPFGYDGVTAALEAAAAAGATTAAAVRDRLLATVEAHTGGRAVEDDRTMVVMRFRGVDGGEAAG
jgi:serine phosphatase RsbU (regulator of sigma subunit)